MAIPEDPQDVATRFWAQLLGFEISYDGPTPGSPLWGQLLVTKLASESGRSPSEVDLIVQEYIGQRRRYCYPELFELWGEAPFPPRTHEHSDVRRQVERALQLESDDREARES